MTDTSVELKTIQTEIKRDFNGQVSRWAKLKVAHANLYLTAKVDFLSEKLFYLVVVALFHPVQVSVFKFRPQLVAFSSPVVFENGCNLDQSINRSFVHSLYAYLFTSFAASAVSLSILEMLFKDQGLTSNFGELAFLVVVEKYKC